MFNKAWNAVKSVARNAVETVKDVGYKVAGFLGLAGSASLLTPAKDAMAAAPDVAAVVTEIGGAAAPIASIGAAVLLVIVGIKVFKWVRRAM